MNKNGRMAVSKTLYTLTDALNNDLRIDRLKVAEQIEPVSKGYV
jgi:hypothetical protein